MTFQPISPFTSSKFRFYAFISMLLLVFVHGYNLQNRYLQPFTVVEEPLSFNTFSQYFLANGIFRFRIPMLFIISGYLFAMHDYKPYKQVVGKRVRTLLLPYVIWSAFGLLLTYALEMIPLTKQYIISSGLMTIDEHRNLLHDYKWYEWIGRWLMVPVPYQLWFIRVLLVYNIIYPGLRWCVERIPKIYFPFVALLWLGTFGLFFVEGEGLLFFSLGILLQKKNFDLEHPPKWLSPVIWGFVFVSLAAVKTWLAFKGFAIMGERVYSLLALLHKVVVFSGLVSVWYGCDALVNWCMQRKWFVWLSAFSFFIYAFHVPLVTYAIDVVFSFTHQWPHYRLLTFVLLPLTIIGLSILVGAVIRKLLPKLYAVLTGGRGL